MFGNDRRDDASDENHYDGAVEDALVEQMRAIGESDVVSNHHHGESHGSVGAGETKHKVALSAIHFVGLLSRPSREPLRDERHGNHIYGNPDGAEVGERADIDEHAHTDKEIGDEERVAHKLETPHEGGSRRNVAIQHNSGKERTEHRLKSDCLRKPRRKESHREGIDKLRNAIGVAFEKPASDARIGI